MPAAPTRFRCKVGGEWKELSEFSNAQQRNLTHLSAGNRRVDPAHSGMTCKAHSAGSRTELRCELCHLVKSIDDFSKNSRRNGEQQCRRCVAWCEIQEPDVTPGPLETGHISPEEELQQVQKQRFFSSSDFFGDDDNLMPRAPITAMSALGFNDEEFPEATLHKLLSESGSSSSLNSSLPPHLRNKVASATPSAATDSVAGSSYGDPPCLPPHLRAKFKSVSAAGSSAASSTNGDISLPTTLRENDSDAASIANQSFNAWDPSGNLQRRTKAITTASESAAASSSTPSEVDNDPNVVGDWSQVAPKPFPGPRRKGGWVKGREARMSAAEIRESLGDVHQPYIRREIDTQKLVRPIGYDSDSD